jgi:hypothetical protein
MTCEQLRQRLAFLGAIVATLLVAGASARAQVGAASPADEARGPGHGWVVLPADDEGHTLWHLPPRLSSAQTEGAVSGTLRVVLRLRDRPEQVAAWGRDVWMISSPRPGGETLLRRVHRLGVRASPLGSGWQYTEGGRLRAEPPLAGRDRLIAAAGSRAGLCALLQAPGASARLWRLERDGWAELELPEGILRAREGAALGLVALADGVGVWLQDGDVIEIWAGMDAVMAAPGDSAAPEAVAGEEADAEEASVDVGRGDSGAAPGADAVIRRMAWELRPLAGSVDTSNEAKLWSVGGRIISTEWAGRTTLRMRDLSGERPVTLAEMDGVDSAAAACALDGSRRIAIVWRDPEGGAGGGTAPKPPWNPRRLIEISTDDGSVMFDGEAQSPGPVSPAEFKLLAAALVVISAGALVFIVRSDDGRRPIVLPDGTALAPAKFRLVAGVVDGSIAWLIGSGLVGSAAEGWLSIDVGGAALDFAPLLATLAVGWGLGALSEWLTGRTPGKWMAGCAVVSVRPGDQRPGLMRAPRFWQALVRNFVKYPLAPVAMLGLASPELRHRGDALAWTAVVIPVVAEESANDER